MNGHVWSRFVRTAVNRPMLKLRTQNVTPDLVEAAADLFTKHFYGEEYMSKAAGIPQNPQALSEAREIFINKIKSPNFTCVICCEDKEGPVEKIIGISSLELIEEPKPYDYGEPETREVQKLHELLRSAHRLFNPLTMLDFPCYYDEYGLTIAPEYRNLGLMHELLHTLELVCESHGVPLIGAVVVSDDAQRATSKKKWETIMEVDFPEFGRRNGVMFQNVPPKLLYKAWRKQ